MSGRRETRETPAGQQRRREESSFDAERNRGAVGGSDRRTLRGRDGTNDLRGQADRQAAQQREQELRLAQANAYNRGDGFLARSDSLDSPTTPAQERTRADMLRGFQARGARTLSRQAGDGNLRELAQRDQSAEDRLADLRARAGANNNDGNGGQRPGTSDSLPSYRDAGTPAPEYNASNLPGPSHQYGQYDQFVPPEED